MQQAESTRGILVVDDDAMNLELLARVVTDSGFHAHAFTDSRTAWDFLCENPRTSDIALLDKMMPGMDGLELLGRIRGLEPCRNMPVIIQTGDVSVEQMRKGIDAGAFYYLTKPFHPDLLTSLLQAAARDVQARRIPDGPVHSAGAFAFLDRGEFYVRTPGQAHDWAYGFCDAFKIPTQAVAGLYELILNGIEHGNLEIGFDRKRELLLANNWDNEVTRRLAATPYRDRCVHIVVQRDKIGMEITIHDEGYGFDSAAYFKGASIKDQLSGPNGRGIAKAMVGLNCRMQYCSNGNEVVCHVYDAQ